MLTEGGHGIHTGIYISRQSYITFIQRHREQRDFFPRRDVTLMA